VLAILGSGLVIVGALVFALEAAGWRAVGPLSPGCGLLRKLLFSFTSLG